MKLLKAYGDDYERTLLGDLVDFRWVPKSSDSMYEEVLNKELKECDILQADVDILVDKTLIDRAPNLKYILCTSIGTDYVDLDYATQKGIIVANNPDFCMIAVAEFAVGLMYSICRRIPESMKAANEKLWGLRDELGGVELFGKNLGLLGFGKIGREVARQAIGIGMKVYAYDPFMKDEDIRKHDAVPVDMDELLNCADIISIHVPLTEGTRNLIGAQELSKMKRTAYIINVSRGGIIDEVALIRALSSGEIKGAALDVTTEEPPAPDNPSLNYEGENLILTPHIAWYTEEAEEKCEIYFKEQVRDIVRGNMPKGIINIQA